MISGILRSINLSSGGLRSSTLICLPLNLVESGRLAQVEMKGNGLRLKTRAIARQAGKHGEFITLYNPQSKQQIRGQVVDFNRVEVEI